MKRGVCKMPQSSASQTLLGDFPAFVPTGATCDDALASPPKPREKDRAGWQRIIDIHLIEWGRNPALFDPDEIVPPSAFIIDAACRVAMRLRDLGAACPLRVVPDGDGGIAFERRGDESFESLEITSDGRVELITFHKSKVVRRQQLPDVSEWA